MRKVIATLVVASISTVLLAPPAVAAQTEVNVRIEGKSETLFEGPILAEPDQVRAASDSEARRCDGVDALDPENTIPGVTPTSTSADALGLIGEGFDGDWYPGYDDYFITRWGPDPQSPGENAYWGILVNDTFTSVGGCQYQLDTGDEVLWIYDAFDFRPNLALFPEEAHYATGPCPLTATVPLGSPFKVEAVAFEDSKEDRPPPSPGIAGSSPFDGAEVAPVVTSAKGFERIDTKAVTTVKTNAEGKAQITFAKPGWHRIKATVVGGGVETAVRSNRLDVCVTGGEASALEKALEGASTCNELPAADKVRAAPPLIGGIGEVGGETGEDESGAGGGSTGSTGSPPPPGPTSTGALLLGTPKLNRKLLPKGKVGVSWTVTSPGPGVAGWAISSLTVGQKGAKWVTRAHGTTSTAATIALPKGHAYELRLAVTDEAGATASTALGTVKVPRPTRHRG
jgi:hypothetical protein